MNNKGEKTSWFVIYTRFKAEKKLCKQLDDDGYTCFLPLYTTTRRWSDRIKNISTPLLPGMLFVKTTVSEAHKLPRHPLARFVLREHGKPAVVHDYEIKNLDIIAREFDGCNVRVSQATHYKPGDYVRVKRGNFKGLEGHLTEIKGRYRLLVQLSKANVAFSINLPASQVEKIAPKKALQVS